ncbi:hypothetical protein HIM_03974 [Hirsutella minnesotensis 3608]|uniref:FAM192A/Fyv6 N-terminal domain-containing protein n=1 Tax=Hirsutella minnesotensis 3608 TaxID=1043627 RepID=A0A0F7ZVH8_9HYPO|nr:hypothetical protein HIM_03974 [Hirsutella minnesotensis 3608]
MSSRFVSGGTIAPSGDVSTADDAASQQPPPPAKKNPEWEAVQQELEAERKRREEARQKAVEGGDTSLYDILQANKAAKQAAFDEKHSLRNQFRALDDDEIAFLDDVKERMRLEEDKLRQETEQGLRAFRQRQKAGADGSSGTEPGSHQWPLGQEGAADDQHGGLEEEWALSRKRKRNARDKDAMRLKRRSSSGVSGGKPPKEGQEADERPETCVDEKQGDEPTASLDAKRETGSETCLEQPRRNRASLLVSYGSDDSDDE